jgi:hypothetical protein
VVAVMCDQRGSGVRLGQIQMRGNFEGSPSTAAFLILEIQERPYVA